HQTLPASHHDSHHDSLTVTMTRVDQPLIARSSEVRVLIVSPRFERYYAQTVDFVCIWYSLAGPDDSVDSVWPRWLLL
ncbi:hypothetical protein HAX54_012546, partial [Datura stramonium]|nr:hypothetical protein [Datura stramonium]